MIKFLLSLVILFCMIGTAESVVYRQHLKRGNNNSTFRLGGPTIYPPIFVHPSYFGYYGWYTNPYHGYQYRRIGSYHCMTCGHFHKYGYSCANPGVYNGFNRGYYYNQRQNQYRHRQRKLKEYLGLENVLK